MNAFFSLVLWSTIVYSWSGMLMAISSYIVTIFYYHNFSFITCKQSKKVLNNSAGSRPWDKGGGGGWSSRPLDKGGPRGGRKILW